MAFVGHAGVHHINLVADVLVVAAGSFGAFRIHQVVQFGLRCFDIGCFEYGTVVVVTRLRALLVEGQIAHLVQSGCKLGHVIAAIAVDTHVVDRVAVRHVGRRSVGGTGEEDSGVVQPEAVGTLNRLDGAGGVAGIHDAVVAHHDFAENIAAEHRGAATED